MIAEEWFGGYGHRETSISDETDVGMRASQLLRWGMDDDALILVADASAAAAGEIRDHLADCLRRLDLVNLPLPAAHLSFAIGMLDEDIRRLTTTSVSELG